MITDKERDLIAARKLALQYEERSIVMGPDHKWLILTAIGLGRDLATVETDRLREALKTVTVSLIACHSLLGAGGKRAAGSDKMFEIMMSDYAKAIEVGRSTAWPETLTASQPKEGE